MKELGPCSGLSPASAVDTYGAVWRPTPGAVAGRRLARGWRSCFCRPFYGGIGPVIKGGFRGGLGLRESLAIAHSPLPRLSVRRRSHLTTAKLATGPLVRFSSAWDAPSHVCSLARFVCPTSLQTPASRPKGRLLSALRWGGRWWCAPPRLCSQASTPARVACFGLSLVGDSLPNVSAAKQHAVAPASAVAPRLDALGGCAVRSSTCLQPAASRPQGPHAFGFSCG